MEGIPPEFLAHLHPLVFVAGLPSDRENDQGPESPSRALGLSLSSSLLRSSLHIWDVFRGTRPELRILPVSMDVSFPPLKAPNHPGTASHSPLSPLTLSSPLYPDGVIHKFWILKHRDLLPSVFVLVLSLPDSNEDPLSNTTTSPDQELISLILKRKASTSERGIKLCVVLLTSTETIVDTSTLDVRLSYIRRNTGLDSKASLFVLSPVSATELDAFVANLKSQLYEAAADYYRERSRRARRKRSRIPTFPPTRMNSSTVISSSRSTSSSTAAPLTPHGWTVRYDYKIAVYAEFRQELPVALKHYEDAYNGFLNLFTTSIRPRSKRWAEARVLSDTLSLKICKLHLYNNNYTNVMAQFTRHIARFSEFSTQWNFGVETCEFWSWLTKQYRGLSELLEIALRAGLRLPVPEYLVDVFPQRRLPSDNNTTPISSSSPALNPSVILQHPGFYNFVAADCAYQRYVRFLSINTKEEKRKSELSPEEMQKYVVPPSFAFEKDFDHHAQIIDLYSKSYDSFKRFPSTLRSCLFIKSRIFSIQSEMKYYEEALKIQGELIGEYRKQEWKSIRAAVLEAAIKIVKTIEKDENAEDSKQDRVSKDELVKILLEYIACCPANTDCKKLWNDTFDSLLPKSELELESYDISMDNSSFFNIKSVFWKNTAEIHQQIPFQVSLVLLPHLPLQEYTFSGMSINFSGLCDTTTSINITPSSSSQSQSPSSLSSSSHVEKFDIGNISNITKSPVQLNSKFLTWSREAREKVFSGTISGHSPSTVYISSISLVYTHKNTTSFNFLFDCPSRSSLSSSSLSSSSPSSLDVSQGLQWLVSSPSSSSSSHRRRACEYISLPPENYNCAFEKRPIRANASSSLDAPAYLHEPFPINLTVQSKEYEYQVSVSADINLRSMSGNESLDEISYQENSSKEALTDIPMGTVDPGQSITRVIYLTSRGSTTERHVDITYHFHAIVDDLGKEKHDNYEDDNSTKDVKLLLPRSTEQRSTVSVPVAYPLQCSFQQYATLVFSSNNSSISLPPSEDGFTRNMWKENVTLNVHTSLGCCGVWPVSLKSVKLNLEGCKELVQLESTCSENVDGMFPLRLTTGEKYGFMHSLSVKDHTNKLLPDTDIAGARLEVVWSRADVSDIKDSTISIALPSLKIPQPISHGQNVIAAIPAIVKQHELVDMIFTIRNGFNQRVNEKSHHTKTVSVSSKHHHHSTSSSTTTGPPLVVSVEVEASDQWVFAGPRKIGRLIIMHGDSLDIVIKASAVSPCGTISAPRLRVTSRLPRSVAPLTQSLPSPTSPNTASSSRFMSSSHYTSSAVLDGADPYAYENTSTDHFDSAQEYDFVDLPVFRKGTSWLGHDQGNTCLPEIPVLVIR